MSINYFSKDVFKKLDLSYNPKSLYTIVKYRPEFYVDGKYIKNEWSSYNDIGIHFDDGILNREEYIRVENDYISCAKDLAREAGCKYLTVAYIEPLNYIITQKHDGSNVILSCGNRLLLSDIDDILQQVIRELSWVIFINNKKGFMLDFGYDMYMHVRCRLNKDVVVKITNQYNLFLDPRR